MPTTRHKGVVLNFPEQHGHPLPVPAPPHRMYGPSHSAAANRGGVVGRVVNKVREACSLAMPYGALQQQLLPPLKSPPERCEACHFIACLK